VGALVLRLSLVPFVAEDFTYFFGPWSEHLRRHGLRALGTRFSDYQPVYLYLLAVTNLLPIPAIWSVKIIPIAADFLLAWYVFRVVHLRFPVGVRALVAGAGVLYVPTVVLNSAVWGQCDTLFTSALLATLYYLLVRRGTAACVAYGIAISFKLQAVFLMPLLALAWSKQRLRFRDLLVIPAVHLITLHPALYMGRPLSSVLDIYPDQAGTYKVLQMGAPNIYQWFSNDHYATLLPVGLLVTLVLVVALVVAFSKVARAEDAGYWVSAALSFLLLMPMFLPSMHERYFYAADVFAFVYAFYFPRQAGVAITTATASTMAYLPYLFGRAMPLRAAAVGLLGCLAVVVTTSLRRMASTPNSGPNTGSASKTRGEASRTPSPAG